MQTSMKVTIYHNPRCSKSRQTLALLEEHDIDIEIIEYFKTPLDQKKLKNIIKLLNIPAADLLRKRKVLLKNQESPINSMMKKQLFRQ